MNPETINIESLVAEVIRRLERLADAPAPRRPIVADTPRDDRAEGDLVVDARVVTLAAIERRLGNVRRVLVQRGAVVTPSVKEDLRKRHIRLEYLTDSTPGGKPADELTMGRCTRTPEAARAATALTHPAGASVMMFDDLRCATQTVATIVADANRLGVLLTDDPLPAVCLANRFPAARAAWVRNVSELREAIAAVGLNFLVVHPAQLAPETWDELLSTYRQGLPRRCPPRLIGAPGQC
jgi:hypothetical protein